MLDGLQPWHIVVLVVVLVLLFGSKRLPDASRSIGRSLRIFKAETKGLRGDDKDEPSADANPAAAIAAPAPVVAAPVAAPAPVAPVMAKPAPAPAAAVPVAVPADATSPLSNLPFMSQSGTPQA